MSEEAVKKEPEWDNITCVSEAAQAELYADHVVKNEVVLGPVCLQPRDIQFALRALSSTRVCKQEQTENHPLQNCCVRIKRCNHLELLLKKRTVKLEEAIKVSVSKLKPMKDCYVQLERQNLEMPLICKRKLRPMLKDCYIQLERLQHQDTLLTCDRFNTPSLLRRANSPQITSETYKCKTCNTRFKDKYSLNYHSQHLYENSCSICKLEFVSECSLNLHIREHAGSELYTCELCQRLFADSSALLRHRQIHMGKKPYTCQVCGKQFTRSSDFLAHKRTHLGDSFSYKCAKSGFSRKVI